VIKPVEMELASKAYNEDDDIDTAIEFYEIAAKKGHVLAMVQLIHIYIEKWENVSSDSEQRQLYEEKVDYWHQKIRALALQNDRDAQFELSIFYFWGTLGFEDHKAAYDWLLKSACNGNPEAQHELSTQHYFSFFGVEPSKTKFRYWLLRAYKNRNKDATYQIACEYYFKLKKYEKGLSLLKKLSSSGHLEAEETLEAIQQGKL
jgi:TPR repeat protein